MTVPISYVWQEGAWRPLGRYAKLAAEVYGEGEVRLLVDHDEPSNATRRHYFATVREAWMNLPEAHAARYPTPDHLRKWALIKAGFRNERSIVCASRAEALRVAAFIRQGDTYGVVVVSGAVVSAYSAKSQRGRAMDKATFAASKEAVLGVLADLIEVAPAALQEAHAA